ncbi:MAG: outer membrane lipoprotein chaperone LolA [Bacteroidota bacterium]|jgi:chaperone LolA
MPVKTGIAAILVAFICLPCAFARGDDDPNEILSRLQKKYDKIQDATASFTQDVTFGVTKNEQSFKGTLWMKKGNKYHIEVEDQTIVTDGKSVWSYSKNTNQVLIDTYHDDPRSFSPDKVLVNVPQQYSATVLSKEGVSGGETIVLKLIPKERSSHSGESSTNLQWMKVWVDRDEWLMKKIQILDVSDNLTTYVIEDLKLNTGLADDQFQYQIPRGAEVIDLR